MIFYPFEITKADCSFSKSSGCMDSFGQGFSLIEVIASTMLLSAIMLIAFMMLSNFNNIYSSTMTMETMRAQTTIALNRISEDLQNVQSDQIIPYNPINCNSLKFKKIISIDEQGDKKLGNYIEWAFDQTSIGEIDNSLDDNHNGLCDEGDLVRREYDENEKIISKVVICSYVMKEDPNADVGGLKGLSFTRIGSSNKIVISLSLEKLHPKETIDPVTKKRRTMRVNLKTLVVLKN